MRLPDWKSSPSLMEGSSFRFAMVTVVLLFRLCRHGCCAGADSVHSQDWSSRYFFSRTALKVPSFDGLSPTRGENSTSPVIKSGVSSFPLNVKVPASRPTLPIKNSTAPENVIAFSSPRLHCASEALDPSQTLDLGSAATKLPFPSARASKRTERCSSFAKVISAFQVPITLGDCASLMVMLRVIKIKISTQAALILFRNPHRSFRQGTKALFANGEMHPATC
jgi:hypothetical protein